MTKSQYYPIRTIQTGNRTFLDSRTMRPISSSDNVLKATVIHTTNAKDITPADHWTLE